MPTLFRPLAAGCVLFLLVLCGACRTADSLDEVESAAVDRVLDLMNQRLALMPAVARAKWNARRAIADPDREKQLLDAVAGRAEEKGMDVEFMRAFIAAQVEAAKRVQQAHFDRWEKAGQARFPRTAALADLRKEIDAVTGELLDAVEQVRPLLARQAVKRAIEKRAATVLAGVDDEARRAALKPLLHGTAP